MAKDIYICNQDCTVGGKRYSIGDTLAEGSEPNKFFDKVEGYIKSTEEELDSDEILKKVNEILSKISRDFEEKIAKLEEKVAGLNVKVDSLDKEIVNFYATLEEASKDAEGLDAEQGSKLEGDVEGSKPVEGLDASKVKTVNKK